MKEKINNTKEISLLKGFMFFTPFLFGGYHIWTSALFSALLSLHLILTGKKSRLNISLTLASLLIIPTAYLVSSLWAVDGGTAIYGFVKFLPVALFALAVSPLSKNEKEEILDVIPYSAAAMGILSYALSFIPALEEQLLVAERLGGFFQYPNSFACFCLAGIPILLFKERVTYKSWILSALLIGIILLTGSRTVFALLVLVAGLVLIKIKKEYRVKLLALLGGALALAVITVLVTGSVQTVGRFLTISLESSTLLGRLLYYKDALPIILKHPAGLGYYGYYFSQCSFQTGVYSVAFIHNDFLQLLLDIGWLPSLLFFFVAAKSLLSKNSSTAQRAVLLIILLHSAFDFDLQFISVFLLLVLTLDFDTPSLKKTAPSRTVLASLLGILVAISLYFGTVNVLFLTGRHETVDRIYGNDTQSQIYLMAQQSNYDKINAYADSIISRNEYMSIAWSAKANYSLKSGDVQGFINNKKKAISCSPYSIEEYNDYCSMLISVINRYLQSGDRESALYCAERLVEVEEMLNETKNKTDPIAWKIIDTPELELNKEYSDYIRRIKQ